MKGLQLISNVDPAVPEIVVTDANRVTQIIINLTSNAIKYTTVGFVKVEVTTTDQKSLFISVRDTGVGMKQTEVGSIFTGFVTNPA